MFVGRLIGWLWIAVALVAMGLEALRSLEAGAWAPQALGLLWYEFAPDSLNVTQAVVQRFLLPELWDPGITWILLKPAWLVFLVPGILLLVVCRRRDGERRRSFR
ncbi:hypothetical protein [Oceanibacterium hippocampi]|uniref:Uncharacterized protein n=1 Tax=Oceanibacterium hippocampi TaxID=745714 RepID=A0A1Y5RT98_9PROT|nr:hypothetical protein [Oceanibacterium hippocampi]SLN23726.1 hypothetical protein OCH7691_00654 [Oceanibacterium hippocampi]